MDLGAKESGSSIFLDSALLPTGGVLDPRQVGRERGLRPSMEASRYLVVESFVRAFVVVGLSKAIEAHVPSLVLKWPSKSPHQVAFGPWHDAKGWICRLIHAYRFLEPQR